MKVGELRTALNQLQQVYLAGGAKGPAKDLQVIADILRPYEEWQASNFVAELSGRLSSGKAKPKAKQKSAGLTRAGPANEVAIVPYLVLLREAGTQQSLFDEALKRLKADRSLSLADLNEIARRYSNSVTKYRSLSAAHNDISQAFIRRARFENKLQ